MRGCLAAIDEATELSIDSLLLYNQLGGNTKLDKLKKGVQTARQVAKGVRMRVVDKVDRSVAKMKNRRGSTESAQSEAVQSPEGGAGDTWRTEVDTAATLAALGVGNERETNPC